MTYTFARVGALLQMRVEDYYIEQRRSWVQLHEKGGKVHSRKSCGSSNEFPSFKGYRRRKSPHRARRG
jgi:hypothetical protein